jgi:hypothetical protein
VKTKKKRTTKRKAWSLEDVRMLKKLAKKNPVKKIARTIGRGEGATRQKAFSLGVSLDTRKAA